MFIESGGSTIIDNSKKPIYIAFFLLSIILMYNFSGGKATYKYLLLVLVTIVLYRGNSFKVTIETPTILKEE